MPYLGNKLAVTMLLLSMVLYCRRTTAGTHAFEMCVPAQMLCPSAHCSARRAHIPTLCSRNSTYSGSLLKIQNTNYRLIDQTDISRVRIMHGDNIAIFDDGKIQ